MNSAYYDKGEEIKDRKMVFLNYLKKQALIDTTLIVLI